MEFGSKFERFIRSGGNGEIVIPWSERTGFETKSDPTVGVSIESLIGHANADNISFLMSFLGDDAQAAIEGVPVEGLQAWVREELRSRFAETGGAGLDEDPVLNGITRQFDAKLNARRQQTLGISHYIWRSQDDNRVRSTHAARDDQTFSWDERLPGGFPGEDFSCRCYAEPVLSPGLCEPKLGLSLTATIESAAIIGYAEAARDFGLNLVGGLFDLAKLAVETVNYGVSELAVLLGIAGDERAAEVEQVREQIAFEIENYDKRLDQLVGAIRGLPDLAAAFLDYADAVTQRAGEMRIAYLRCEVSETELREAIREEAYLKASVAIAAVPAIGLIGTIAARSRKLLRVLGDDADGLSDADALRKLTERVLVPTLPRGFRGIDVGDVDWEAGTVKDRGLSYERNLRDRKDDEGRGIWLEEEFRDHPGVDFFNFETGQATSVKTLDLDAYTYRTSPSQIYGTLSQYLRDLAEFDGGEGLIDPGKVEARVLQLAVPEGSPEQMSQIRRAVDLAEDLGIEMIVEVTG
ncbi:minor capsid protein [Sulfitobacter sp. PR48]|uniref:endonuclease toxin domain-containing protein n=1 Tax=Sulfitobacter sp. PR48 TaxID=3028383 RepID=UPI00237BF7B8|nr:minor capsid protein [Sulfitobacter sp. PR48]MDD9722428.1 minor capsid protein [Sulfitobacter sp. PR48]